MARRFRRGSRRGRTRWLWSGINAAGAVALYPAKTIVQILSPAQVATVSDMTVTRVVFDLHFQCPETGFSEVGAYLTTVPTDVTETPSSDALWPPLSTDIDASQKRPMWARKFVLPGIPYAGDVAAAWCGTMGPAFFEPAVGEEGPLVSLGGCINNGQPFDITVKRKLGGDQALVLVLQTFDNQSANFFCFARALVSVGRK